MIRHIVLLDLPDEYDRDELAQIMSDIEETRNGIEGFTCFEHGVNKDFEGMSIGCTYALICHFKNEDTLRKYLINPIHHEHSQRVVDICIEGVNGIKVIDVAIAA